MDGFFVGSDVIVEIYRFALQLLAYIMGSAALIGFVGGLFCIAQAIRGRETEPGVQNVAAAVRPRPYGCPQPSRRLYLVRTQQ